MTTINERLRAIREKMGESQKSMASRFGLSENAWQRLELEGRAPKGDVLAQLVDLGFSSDWLLTGRGKMQPDVAQAVDAATEPSPSSDPDLYGRVLEAISAVYKEMGWGISLRQLGAEAAQIANEIAAEGLKPDEKPPAVKAAAAMLRRQLRAAAADPTAQASTKGRA